MDESVHPWVELRRQRHSVAAIAREAGVSHQWVSQVTAPHGPFPKPALPSPSVVDGWVEARRRGVTIAELVRTTGRSDEAIRRATRAYGPFPEKRGPEGYLGVNDIADRLHLPNGRVSKWRSSGFLPEPALLIGARELWTPEQIEQWVATAGLQRCPQCGARPRDLRRHSSHAHRRGTGRAVEE